jgi:predicted Zn finger-like uncharacterized protein
VSDTDLRYSFTCPSCSGNFSISLDRIPPVKARFSCPRCGTSMEFPSREEARIYVMLQKRDLGNAPFPPPEDPTYAAEPPAPPAPAKLAAAPPPPPRPANPAAPAAAKPATPPAAAPPRPANRPSAPPPPPPPAERAEQSYVIHKTGFEGDRFDRRGIRTLIRTGALGAADQVSVDGAAAVRADSLQDLRSLFELRKNAKFQPPAVCPKHLDRLAHYVCSASRRPLCEECAEEKKFGGTSVRVCAHCSGNVEEIPVASE